MAGVDVYKNPSASQIEGAIGGFRNLRTALPFDYSGFKGAVSVDATRGSLSAKTKPSISRACCPNTWNTPASKIGLLIDATHSLGASRTDGLVLDLLQRPRRRQ